MLAFIIKYRYALAVIAVLIALHVYIGIKIKQATDEVKKDHKIEKLEDNNRAMNQDIETRKKQNAVIIRDISPSTFSNVLREGGF
jgi:cell division protein FtsB